MVVVSHARLLRNRQVEEQSCHTSQVFVAQQPVFWLPNQIAVLPIWWRNNKLVFLITVRVIKKVVLNSNRNLHQS